MENSLEYIDGLIARCLSGQAAEAEQAELTAWRNQSEENENYYRDLEFIFQASAHKQQAVDTDKAWAKLSAKIAAKDKAPVVSMPANEKKPANTAFILRIAASVIFILGLVGILYKKLSQGPSANDGLAIVAEANNIEKTLPDGSQVTLRPHSSLKALQIKNSQAREYALNGEAFFNVVHDKQHPFIIHADKVLVKDIGTSFDLKAIDGSDSIHITVLSGSVQFYSNEQSGITLKAGDEGIYQRASSRFIKVEKKPDVQEFQFDDAPLAEVVDMLNSVYDTKIRLGSEQIKECRISVKFHHQDIHNIADIISSTLGLSASAEGNDIVLYGNKCN